MGPNPYLVPHVEICTILIAKSHQIYQPKISKFWIDNYSTDSLVNHFPPQVFFFSALISPIGLWFPPRFTNALYSQAVM